MKFKRVAHNINHPEYTTWRCGDYKIVLSDPPNLDDDRYAFDIQVSGKPLRARVSWWEAVKVCEEHQRSEGRK